MNKQFTIKKKELTTCYRKVYNIGDNGDVLCNANVSILITFFVTYLCSQNIPHKSSKSHPLKPVI